MLQVNKLNFGYVKKPLCIRDFSIKLNVGEACLVVGGEGMGKTSLLKVLCGLEKQYVGNIKVDGKELSSIPNKERNITYLPTEPVLINKTIKHNIDFLCKVCNKKISDEEVLNVFKKFNFNYSLNTKIKKLPLEDKRIFALIRSFLKGSKFVYIDDQFDYLDDKKIIKIKNALKVYFSEKRADIVCFMAINNKIGLDVFEFNSVIYMTYGDCRKINSISDLKSLPIDYFVSKYVDFYEFDRVILKKKSDYYVCEFEYVFDKKCKIKDICFKKMVKISQKFNNICDKLNIEEDEYIKIKLLTELNLTDLTDEKINKYLGEKIFLFDEGTGERLF